MLETSRRFAYAFAFASLLALSAVGDAQRGGGGGAGGGRAGGGHASAGRGGRHAGANRSHASAGRSSHANPSRSGHAGANRGSHSSSARGANVNHHANGSRNANVNRNTNVNRNVNRNTNVNVNRNVNVNWNRAPVRAGVYAWPRGYGYVRRPIGYLMPRPFLTSAYFYTGWATLGLAAPGAGYQWVRYGPDLMLVEIGTGRVVDVRYGVFAG